MCIFKFEGKDDFKAPPNSSLIPPHHPPFPMASPVYYNLPPSQTTQLTPSETEDLTKVINDHLRIQLLIRSYQV